MNCKREPKRKESRSTSISLYRGGLNFFRAVEIIRNSGEKCPPDAYSHLASHSLELILKSYLVSLGKSPRTFRHDLVEAWKESVKNDLEIAKEIPEWCEILNSGHHRPIEEHSNTDFDNSYLFRYAQDNAGIVTYSIDFLYQRLDELLNIVGKKLGLNRLGDVV